MSRRLIVVTPARNEAAYLPHLVEAMRCQERRPDRWIIIDDGSTDGTGTLARQLCRDLPFVDVVVPCDGGGTRNFASKAAKFNRVVAMSMDDTTEVIVGIDADIVPPPTYLADVEREFDRHPDLGVFGGPLTHRTLRGTGVEPFPPDVVPGGGQAIRRAAFEQIGGYWTLPFGGIDTAACVAVQMHGWHSRLDDRLVLHHLRPMGTGEGQALWRAMFKRGRQDYDLGMPWWFHLGKATRWLVRRPYMYGSVCLVAGYLRSAATRTPRTPPESFIEFNRRRSYERVARRIRGVLS